MISAFPSYSSWSSLWKIPTKRKRMKHMRDKRWRKTGWRGYAGQKHSTIHTSRSSTSWSADDTTTDPDLLLPCTLVRTTGAYRGKRVGDISTLYLYPYIYTTTTYIYINIHTYTHTHIHTHTLLFPLTLFFLFPYVYMLIFLYIIQPLGRNLHSTYLLREWLCRVHEYKVNMKPIKCCKESIIRFSGTRCAATTSCRQQ